MAEFKRGQLVDRIQTVSSGGVTTLTFSSPKVIRVEGSSDHTVILPVMEEHVALNMSYTIRSKTSGKITIKDSSNTDLFVLDEDSEVEFFLVDPTVLPEGQWEYYYTNSSIKPKVQELNNNQVTPEPILDMNVDNRNGVKYEYTIIRKSTTPSSELVESGSFRVQRLPISATYRLTARESGGDNSLVDFTVDSGGQVFYTSSNLAGQDLGEIEWNVSGYSSVISVGQAVPPTPVDFKVEYYTITATDVTNEYFELTEEPNDYTQVSATIRGGPDAFYGIDYDMILGSKGKNRVSWTSPMALSGQVQIGDVFKVEYIKKP